MLIKLLPEQVSRDWDYLKFYIKKSLPPSADGNSYELDNLLLNIVSGNAECWLVVKKIDYENSENLGVLVTQITIDNGTQTKNLMIYAMSAVLEKPGGKSYFIEAYKTISKYAKSKGCNKITGFTKEQQVLKFVDILGGNSEYRFVTLPLSI